MNTAQTIDLLTHLTMIGSFGGVLGYVANRRQLLRRTTKQASRLYRSVALVCLLFIGLNLAHLIQTWQGWHDPISGNLTVIGGTIVLGILLLVLMTYRLPLQPTRNNRRILAVGAHPDDLEIACGGTLAKLRDAGHEIHGLVLTNGERGGDALIRKEEAERGARFLGFNSLTITNFQDGCLGAQGIEVVNAIEAQVKASSPTLFSPIPRTTNTKTTKRYTKPHYGRHVSKALSSAMKARRSPLPSCPPSLWT